MFVVDVISVLHVLLFKSNFCDIFRLPNEKLYTLDSDQDAILVLRAIGAAKQKTIYFRDYRAHMMAEAVSYELENDQVKTKFKTNV